MQHRYEVWIRNYSTIAVNYACGNQGPLVAAWMISLIEITANEDKCGAYGMLIKFNKLNLVTFFTSVGNYIFNNS